MKQEFKPGMCVIGADPGGFFLAAGAAALDVPTVLIDKGPMGADWYKKAGFVPVKALLAAAERAHAVSNSSPFGIKMVRFGVDFTAVMTHVNEVIDAVAPNSSRARIGGLGVGVVPGEARFTDAETVEVGDFVIKADRFVIATGSSPLIPALPGLLDTPHFTSETICTLTECPRHLIVIGAGSVGLALAQAFRRLGAEVTVLEAAVPLANHDRECVAVVLDALAREGIKLRTEVEITKVRRALGKVQVEFAAGGSGETIEGSHLLIATGRRPNLDGLELEAAGIRYDPRGIAVDDNLRTTNKRVYALGDATGGPKFAHVSTYHAGLVIRHALFRLPAKVNPHAIPWVTSTDPEIAEVGLREHDARAQYGAIRVLRWPYRENDRAQAERTTRGHVKVITNRKGNILGVTIVGAQAAENIGVWTLAISQKLKIDALANLVAPYPSYAEMGKYAALTFYSRGLTSARVRRIIGWLRRRG